jgi:NAD(P)-dependent dehydrogenase (short-subunit alcohol dehydrogenase family)
MASIILLLHSVLALLERRGGTVVNVSSNATRGIRRAPYSAAEGGVSAITRSLAMEHAEHDMRVVATGRAGPTHLRGASLATTPATVSRKKSGWAMR